MYVLQVTSTKAIYADSPQALEKPLATLTIDLNTIDSLPYQVKDDGRHYYNIPFEVSMTLNSAELTFNLVRGKEKYKPATVTVNESEWLS